MSTHSVKGSLAVRAAGVMSVALLILSSTVLPACTNEPSGKEEVIPDDFATYQDAGGLFRISYPGDWHTVLSPIRDLETSTNDIIHAIESDTAIDTARIVFVAGRAHETGGYLPALMIVVHPKLIMVDDVVQLGAGMLRGRPVRELSRATTNVHGRKAAIFETVGTYPQYARFGEVQDTCMFVIVGRTVWEVTCTCRSGQLAMWKDDFRSIVGSLRILRQASYLK